MSNFMIVKSFEIVTLLLWLYSLWWTLRTRNPLFLGALLGATLTFGFDWSWIQKDFFNVTYNPDLFWLPGLGMMGIREPLVIPLAYGMAFGPFVVMLVMSKDWFDKKFGLGGYGVVWLIGAVGVMAYEIPVVHILEIWTYHQHPEYMIYSVPWSDIWLAGNMVGISYAGVRWMERWAQLPENLGFGLNQETTWKGLVMGAMPIWTAFYLTYLIQIFWYSYATPWIEGVRAF